VRGAADGRRVAVTGIGVVSPCGTGVADFWAGLLRVPADDRERPVPDWDPSPWLERRHARHTDRFAQFAIACADLALADGGLAADAVDPERAAVSVGTGIGGVATFEAQVLVREHRGAGRVSPYTIPMVMPNAGSASVSMRLGWQGPCETLTTACAAGTHSVASAARMIAVGLADVALGGGADASIVGTTLAGFTTMTAMTDSGVSRPFDAARDGFAIGEGAALLLLEELGAARARGARVYAVIAGAGNNADAHHITAPSPAGRGAAACMRQALRDAGLEPSTVVHVNAHGTSTPQNDAAEAAALRTVFGNAPPPVTSIKGVTGHTLGAAGAIEAAAAVLTIAHGVLPPTAGFVSPDADTDHLDVVMAARPFAPGVVLSNSFGFGGHNGTLVLTPA